MSRYDELYLELFTFEGVVSRFKNRNVHQRDAAWLKDVQKVKSIDELFTGAKEQGEDQFNWSSKKALVEGKYVVIAVRNKDNLPDNVVKVIKTGFSNIGKVQLLLAKKITTEYNDSQGKKGPWAWTDTEFKKKSISDVTNKIKFDSVDIIVTKNGVRFGFIFDGGGLWDDHAIMVFDAIDMKTGAVKNTLKYGI